jgi:hypothetical protein
VLLFVFLFSCGIESYPYLYPPEVSSILENEKIMTFSNNEENNPDLFIGFEVYYKFYTDDSGHADFGDMTTDINSITSQTNVNTLTQMGFSRLYVVSPPSSVSQTVPAIDIPFSDRTSYFEVTVDFSTIATDDTYPSCNYLSTSLQLGRWVREEGSTVYELKGFNPASFPDTVDYSDIDSSYYDDIDYVWCVLYVLAYGRYDFINDLYSSPVLLGKIKIDTS